jgi:hypothetical protein
MDGCLLLDEHPHKRAGSGLPVYFHLYQRFSKHYRKKHEQTQGNETRYIKNYPRAAFYMSYHNQK